MLPSADGETDGAVLTGVYSSRASLIKRPGVVCVRTCGLKRKEDILCAWRKGQRALRPFKNKNFTTWECVPNKSCQNNKMLSLLYQIGVVWITSGLKFLWQELLEVYAECQLNQLNYWWKVELVFTDREKKCCSLEVEGEVCIGFNSITACFLLRFSLILVPLQQMLRYPYRSKISAKNITCQCELLSTHSHENFG